MIPLIKESSQFKTFTGIDEQFPELRDNDTSTNIT